MAVRSRRSPHQMSRVLQTASSLVVRLRSPLEDRKDFFALRRSYLTPASVGSRPHADPRTTRQYDHARRNLDPPRRTCWGSGEVVDRSLGTGDGEPVQRERCFDGRREVIDQHDHFWHAPKVKFSSLYRPHPRVRKF